MNLLFLSALLCSARSCAQNDFRIYLVGDAGDHTEAGETLINLQRELIGHPEQCSHIYG